jgi:NAD+ synthase
MTFGSMSRSPARSRPGLPMVYVNQIGGQDELVFDGASFGLNPDRTLGYQMAAFEEAVALTRWKRGDDGWVCRRA